GFDDSVYMGDTRTCDDPDAACEPPPTSGACCLPDGSCLVGSLDFCTQAMGFFIEDETCDALTCATACCLEDGGCRMTPGLTQCQSLGAPAPGSPDACVPDPCGVFTGACCFNDGRACVDGNTRQACDTAGGRFQEVVSQIRVVKSYVTEASEQKQFNNHYDATVDATRQQSNHWHLMDTVRRVVLNVIFFGIYAIIFVRTAKGYFGVGDMILLIQLMTMARQPVQMMSYIIDVAQRAVAGSKDYFSVMETRPAHVPQTATTTIREPEPGVPMISFNDTVANNIAYGKTEASSEAVVQAAQQAFAHEFIQGLPQGYDTIVGEGGSGLSGGQLQRIVIARAILKNPRILIFDEATSQVDADSESKIHKAIQEIMAHRTTLIIAHRFSTVIAADQIVVVDKGQIVAKGTHDELMLDCSLYQGLYETQLVS
ncbi:MAG: ABC transporter ATP-binding protein, partial [Planctomycetes bacterium]|nr:ABC transporter ATP-binding protein [Planctomycetota bacterium]